MIVTRSSCFARPLEGWCLHDTPLRLCFPTVLQPEVSRPHARPPCGSTPAFFFGGSESWRGSTFRSANDLQIVKKTKNRSVSSKQHRATFLNPNMEDRDTRSNAPTPSTDTTVASGSTSVMDCNTCATHSVPALVESANWKGAVATSTARVICWLMVRGDEPCHNVADHNAPDTTTGLVKRCDTNHFHHSHDLIKEVGPGKPFTELPKQLGIADVVGGQGVTNFGLNQVRPSCFTISGQTIFGQHQLWPY